MKHTGKIMILLFCLLAPHIAAAADTFVFSGYEWEVKESSRKIGPGPNPFSRKTVTLRDNGTRLEIMQEGLLRANRWYSAEFYSTRFFSYGTFRLEFTLGGRLDSRAVFGFFLYNGDAPPHYNEIDVEFARWGIPSAPEGQFSVQPYENAGHHVTFSLPRDQQRYTAEFVWKPDRVDFRLTDANGDLVSEWSYWNADPDAANTPPTARVHCNLWLFEGKPPAGDGSLGVQVHSFSYFVH